VERANSLIFVAQQIALPNFCGAANSAPVFVAQQKSASRPSPFQPWTAGLRATTISRNRTNYKF
jgi:hypothetical protein